MKKNSLIIAFFVFILFVGSSCNNKLPESKPVDGQLEAYNRRNLDDFSKFFADSIKLYRMPEMELFADGMDDFRKVYGNLFERRTELNAIVVNRIICGDFVIDEEIVTGLVDDKTVHATATYEIQNGKIVKVWFIKE